MGLPSSLEERLRALREQMIAGLPARGAELRAALELLQQGDETAREEIQRHAHRLRGVAGTHGLIALGDLAGEVEDLARAGAADLLARARVLVSAIEKSAAPAEAPAIGAPSARDAPLLSGLRVVAVDDDAATRKLLELTLVSLGGAEARVLEDPEEALALIRGPERLDLVIVDAMMPTMNGITFATSARRERTSLPLVFLSAAKASELGWEPLERTTWLRKPFRPRDLISDLSAFVRR